MNAHFLLMSESNATDDTTKLLQKLQSGAITLEECQKELKSKKTETGVTYKVSPKGCISFYGIRRMPISLYKQELEAIIRAILEINEETGLPAYNQTFRDFLESHEGKLSIKE
jgi:hypothetical protein